MEDRIAKVQRKTKETDISINLIGELIAIVEASAESLYLIAVTSQTNNIFSAIMFEIKHKTLLIIIVSYTHNMTFTPAKLALFIEQTNFV